MPCICKAWIDQEIKLTFRLLGQRHAALNPNDEVCALFVVVLLIFVPTTLCHAVVLSAGDALSSAVNSHWRLFSETFTRMNLLPVGSARLAH